MLNEFRQFILRGNVVDMAIGIVIGAAFNTLVQSFVDNVLMPPVGLLLGRVQFSDLFIDLSGVGYATLADAEAASAPIIRYGLFITQLINYLIIAFVIFLLVRQINKLHLVDEEEAED
jgi:large conductance mechanosensitive channel